MVESVAGYEFSYLSSNTIQVWKDGKFYSLTDAYNQGILTAENIAAIKHYETLNGYYVYSIPGEKLKNKTEKELYDLAKSSIIVPNEELRVSIEECFKSKRDDIQWYDIDASLEYAYYDVRFYYADEKTALLFVPNQLTVETVITIGGYVFKYPNGCSLLVFRDGELIDASEAYERRLITYDKIITAAERHQIVQYYIETFK